MRFSILHWQLCLYVMFNVPCIWDEYNNNDDNVNVMKWENKNENEVGWTDRTCRSLYPHIALDYCANRSRRRRPRWWTGLFCAAQIHARTLARMSFSYHIPLRWYQHYGNIGPGELQTMHINLPSQQNPKVRVLVLLQSNMPWIQIFTIFAFVVVVIVMNEGA